MLRSKKASDFQDSASIKAIKQQILNAVNPSLSDGKFIDVYFDKLVIQ